MLSKPRLRATIICKACGWRKRVARAKAAGEILYHRDVECSGRLSAPDVPPGHGRLTSAKRAPQRLTRAKRSFCPTCRGELSRINGALACLSGCTVEARAG